MSAESVKPPSREGDAATARRAPDAMPTLTCAVDGCVLGYWKRVLIGVWAIPSSMELVEEQDALMKQLSAPAKLSSVHLVIKRAPLPAADVREAYQALTQRYADKIICSAILIEGDGFWASAVRAFMTGIEMLQRRMRTKAFGDLESLSAWVAQSRNAEASERIEAEELRGALEWMLEQPCVRSYRTSS